jgi:trehalose/maltose hydrolase-like predicted phosphorylase
VNVFDTWSVREDSFYAPPGQQQVQPVLPALKRVLSQETVFTIGNGYFCTRGTFEEGYPHATPATLLYGVFDAVPIAKEELANTPDWTTIKLFVNGERFRLDRGTLIDYQRELNLHNGLLRRSLIWQSPQNVRVQISAERFASLADEHLGVVRYSLRVQDSPDQQPVEIRLFAGIESGQGNYDLLHWETADQGSQDESVWLRSETKASGVQLGQAMSFNLTTNAAQEFQKELIDSDLAPGIRFVGTLAPAESLDSEKIVAMYTSRDGVGEVIPAALARLTELEAVAETVASVSTLLLEASTAAWEQYWALADVVLEGDEPAQLGLRYNLYQLRINVVPHDSRYSIAAKGLTGFGYRGHVFHDTEIFMLPFFTYVLPEFARSLLLYRYNLLPAARAKAAHSGYKGAQYPWESTLNGEETTPAAMIHPETGEVITVLNGTLELHITANIAHAIWEYYRITNDSEFLRDYGTEVLLSTAEYWVSRVAKDEVSGQYVINNVIGPDEWHEHVNNNAYTNAMARHNIEIALQAERWLREFAPEKAAELHQQLGLGAQQFTQWREVADHLRILQNPENGLIEQFEGFFTLLPFDQSRLAGRKQSYQGLLGMEEVQKYQLVKQADVLMLLTALNQQFDEQTKKVNWDYYYPITDHDYGSSLTPALHVILASQVGDRNAAYQLFMKGALVDLNNQRGNTPEGIHAACSGAVWQAAILGVAGLRITEEGYTTSPLWPDSWTRLAFSFSYKGERVYVDLRR